MTNKKDHFLRNATKITPSSDTQRFSGTVGKTDLTDLYTFSLGQNSSLDLDLTDLSNNVDIELYQRNESGSKKSFNKIRKVDFSQLFKNPFTKGLKLKNESKKDFNKSLTRLAISKKGGKKDEQIATELETGEYYIRVRPTKGSSKKKKIKYTLNLSATNLDSNNTPPSIGPLSPETPIPVPVITPSPSSLLTPFPSPVATPSPVAVITPAPNPVVAPTPSPMIAPVPVATPTPTIVPDGNESVGTALGFTLREQSKTYSNSDLVRLPVGANPFSISNTDTSDYYTFTLGSRADVNLTVGGFSNDLDVRLLDNNQQPIQLSENGGTTSEQITQTLNSGTYFLEVYQPLQGSESSYTLMGSAQLRDNNDTLATADHLGTLGFQSKIFNNTNTSLADQPFSIKGQDTVDYFKFTLPWESEIRFKLTDLVGDLKMSILTEAGEERWIPEVAGVGTADEVIAPSEQFNPTLAAGDYILKVEAEVGGAESENYSLNLAAIPIQKDTFETGDTVAEAREFPAEVIGNLRSQTSFSNSLRFGDTDDSKMWVGGEDPEDYFKIEIEETSYISIDLVDLVTDGINSTLDNNLNLQLLQHNNAVPDSPNVIATSARDGSLAEVVGGQLEAGTYYIRVSPNAEVDGAYYQMDLALFPLNDVPALTEDINPTGDGVTLNSGELEIVSFDAGVYFVADDGSGPAIWESRGASDDPNDGTITNKKDFNGAAADIEFDSIKHLSIVDNKLYFVGKKAGSGETALWYQGASGLEQLTGVGGSNSGTELLELDELSDPSFTVVDGELYFMAFINYPRNPAIPGSSGYELWKANGSDVSLLTNFDPDVDPEIDDPLENEPNGLTVAGSTLYFTDNEKKLHYYNTANSSTSAIEDSPTPAIDLSGIGDAENMTTVGNDLYFTTKNGNDYSLKVIREGAPSSIVDVSPSGTLTGIGELVSVTRPDGSTALYFTATNNGEEELWYVNSSGVDSGAASLVLDLAGGESSSPTELTVMGNDLFFTAKDANGDRELWKLNINRGSGDFHVAPTVPILDINAIAKESGNGTQSSSPSHLTAVNGVLYFRANDGIHGPELWKSDGTAGGTQLVWDIRQPFSESITNDEGKVEIVTTNLGSEVGNFVNVGNRLFFTANGTNPEASALDDRPLLGEELWVLGLKDTP